MSPFPQTFEQKVENVSALFAALEAAFPDLPLLAGSTATNMGSSSNDNNNGRALASGGGGAAFNFQQQTAALNLTPHKQALSTQAAAAGPDGCLEDCGYGKKSPFPSYRDLHGEAVDRFDS